ncbi:Gfo/Idh/MocA family protein [Phaeacidiphilus oryzae]|uniref:Gfo/Idh/MocA family protein n=1 Tax=Phaeacidiphilus oryzae TaxID=348818 RepID=UPI000A04A53B|nr:Gfo/Idh/MocA family oxidoreductase [Phaeacidiphilus oryzae]
MIGHAFMGAAHSQAWRTAPRAFDLPLSPRLSVLAGRRADAAAAAAERLGWEDSTDDWRSVLHRPDVQLVDICTPGDSHAEIAIAALDAGKHVLCEKPLANTVEEAEAMAAAARRARERGVHAMVGFNYRRVPALALARRLIAEGRLGAIRHVRAAYLQDWLADPAAPYTWRMDRERAGSGALGDLGAHLVDLTQYLIGDAITEVSARTETFTPVRRTADGEEREVTVDDAVAATARFAGGALGVYEASRCATGRKNALRVEISGELGAVAFDLESLNELSFHDATLPAAEAGFRRILATEPDHPYLEGWWPPGHGLGYEHTFSHQIRDLVTDLAKGRAPSPSFEDGLQVQRVLAAIQSSAEAGSRPTAVPTGAASPVNQQPSHRS